MVVIGALIEKEIGVEAFQHIHTLKGVEYVFVETGRSDDLFENKQFGGFGEASILTLLVADQEKDNVFSALKTLCGLDEYPLGEIFMEENIIRSTL